MEGCGTAETFVIVRRSHAAKGEARATQAFVERAQCLIDHPFDVTQARSLPDQA